MKTSDDLSRNYPALSKLGLSAELLLAIGSQGFLSDQSRGHRHYSKLRFRIDGKQHVKYVRREDRDAVAAELGRLQATRKLQAALRAESRGIRRILIDARALLDAELQASRLYFHGTKLRAIRKSDAP